ncbi:MAG: class I SAM-dependent methyltransferase [Gammaproteobacteria bacterium]
MKNRFSLVAEAHKRIAPRLHAGNTAIDATVGNGYDTLFLLQRVAPSGRVYGFDIQASALHSAKTKIADPVLSECLTLVHASHAAMEEWIPERGQGQIDAVMFNLGYLPGSDKTVMTQAGSTVAALTAAGKLLANGGILTVIAYPGHAGGALETAQVADWCANLDRERFDIELIENSTEQISPKLFVVNKIREST